MNKFGFAGGSSQAQVDAAVQAFRKFESLMMNLSKDEKAQVYEKAPVTNLTELEEW